MPAARIVKVSRAIVGVVDLHADSAIGIIDGSRAMIERIDGRTQSAIGIIDSGGTIAERVDGGLDAIEVGVENRGGAVAERVVGGLDTAAAIVNGGDAMIERIQSRFDAALGIVKRGGAIAERIPGGLEAAQRIEDRGGAIVQRVDAGLNAAERIVDRGRAMVERVDGGLDAARAIIDGGAAIAEVIERGFLPAVAVVEVGGAVGDDASKMRPERGFASRGGVWCLFKLPSTFLLLGTILLLRIAGAALVTVPSGLAAWALGYDAMTCWYSVAFIAVSLPFFLAQSYGMVFRGRDRMGLDAWVSVAKIEAQLRWVADCELFLLAKALAVSMEQLLPSGKDVVRFVSSPNFKRN